MHLQPLYLFSSSESPHSVSLPCWRSLVFLTLATQLINGGLALIRRQLPSRALFPTSYASILHAPHLNFASPKSDGSHAALARVSRVVSCCVLPRHFGLARRGRRAKDGRNATCLRRCNLQKRPSSHVLGPGHYLLCCTASVIHYR